MRGQSRRVLVLNASYEPIHVCSVRRALVMVWKGAARVEEDAGRMVRAVRTAVAEPSVIRLTEYRRIPPPRGAMARRGLSRRNILLRDRHTCQYCGVAYAASQLTLDHVRPRSRGGGGGWENLVTSCRRCNARKGDRTPEEARMPLLRAPRVCTGRHLLRELASSDERWKKYVFA